MKNPSIFNYIKSEEAKFQTEEIQVGDNWHWNFRNHVQLLFHLTNGIFYTGDNKWLRAFKNIIEPMLNLSFWTEDIEVKDVVFFIESETGRALSFLIKKYHDEVYSREHNLDTLFDEITETDLTYGGVLVKKAKGTPEVIPFNSIAFADQTDLLGAPLAFKLSFAPDKLRGMSKLGWGEESNGATTTIEDLILLAEYDKDPQGMINGKKNQITGKNIDVYIVMGNLPEAYLKDNDEMEKVYEQVQVVAFYVDKKDKKQGVTLYRKKGKEGNLKFHTSKKVHGRALGRGDGEALLHDQIWTNFLTIHKMAMLEGAAKNVIWTDDPNYANRNKIYDLENNEVTTLDDGKRIGQVPTVQPNSIALYERSINELYQHAQLSSAAFDSIMGKEESAGTTFRGQERLVAQGRGLHDRRRGQRAKFIEEIYRDWIIPDMVSEILNGKEFLATLSSDELSWVSEQLAENYVNKQQLEDIFNLKIPADKELLKQAYLEKFSKKGNKHLVKILKDEFRGIEVRMGINIAGKQKNLTGLSDKILSVFQFALANPIPPHLQKQFNDILEYGGLSQADFNLLKTMPQPQQQPMEASKLALNAPVAA